MVANKSHQHRPPHGNIDDDSHHRHHDITPTNTSMSGWSASSQPRHSGHPSRPSTQQPHQGSRRRDGYLPSPEVSQARSVVGPGSDAGSHASNHYVLESGYAEPFGSNPGVAPVPEQRQNIDEHQRTATRPGPSYEMAPEGGVGMIGHNESDHDEISSTLANNGSGQNSRVSTFDVRQDVNHLNTMALLPTDADPPMERTEQFVSDAGGWTPRFAATPMPPVSGLADPHYYPSAAELEEEIAASAGHGSQGDSFYGDPPQHQGNTDEYYSEGSGPWADYSHDVHKSKSKKKGKKNHPVGYSTKK